MRAIHFQENGLLEKAQADYKEAKEIFLHCGFTKESLDVIISNESGLLYPIRIGLRVMSF